MSEGIIVAAAEIGTSKVCVLIGDVSEQGRLSIIGHGQCSSKGVRKGEIYDLRAACNCLQSAIDIAETRANLRLENLFLAQTGGHLKGQFNEGIVNVRNANGVITEEDVKKACDEAKGLMPPDERIWVVHIRNPFRVDDRVVEEPVGEFGSRLSAGYWSVSGVKQTIQDQIRLLQGISIEVEDLILSSTASAGAVLQESEKRSGCIVLDIGGGTTDYVFYKDGFIVRAGVIAVGGEHITNDLSIGLHINAFCAENLKKEHGHAIASDEDKRRNVWVHGDHSIGDRECNLFTVHTIIEVRMRELFEIVRKEWQSVLGESKPGSGVVLTGGSARLAGITELATKVFASHARIGKPPAGIEDAISGVEYSTCIGSLIYASKHDMLTKGGARPVAVDGLLRKLKGFFG
jgi:cell division protein FtsA